MAQVIVAPDLVAVAAADLAAIGSTLDAAHLQSAATLAVVPAAADEVSIGIAQLFSQQGQDYQKAAGAAAAYHEQFVRRLTETATGYANADSANAAALLPLDIQTAIIQAGAVLLNEVLAMNAEFSAWLLDIHPLLHAAWSSVFATVFAGVFLLSLIGLSLFFWAFR